MILRAVGRAFLAAAGGVAGFSCGSDDITQPGTGTLEVTSSTTGAEPDADGYTIQIDAGHTQALESSGTARATDLASGDHVIQLTGVSANCSVAGSNPRSFTITAGATSTVTFEVTCRATIGSLQVSTITTGPSPDPDGYQLNVDGTEQGTLGQTDEVTVASIAPGEHQVGLSGVTGNCQVEGENPRSVTFTPGESASADFEVTCDAPPRNAGSLRITTTTSGGDPDPDGYSFTLDGDASQPIGVNASATLDKLTARAHRVELSGIAENCSLEGPNPRSATVSSDATIDVSFAITCSVHTGTVQVSVTTAGTAPDPDGYLVQLDGGDTELPIPAVGTVSFPRVRAGTHVVVLTGLTANCSVADDTSRSVEVSAGATAEVSFAVTCAAGTGSIEVTTTTSGSDLDSDGYTVTLEGREGIAIDRNGRVTLAGLEPGPYQVTLGGLSTNCRAQGQNPQRATVSAGADVTIAFAIRCNPKDGKIAFVSFRDGNQEIYVMNPDGSDETRLTHEPEYDHSPAWSPDGSKIAFVSLRDGNDDIYVMNSDGSGVTNLTNGGRSDEDKSRSDNEGPTWSPDGRKIAFSSLRYDSDGVWGGGIWVMNSDGSGQTRLTTAGETSPAWSPDGRKIAFHRDRFADRGDGTSGGNTDVVLMNADGTDPVQVFTSIIACAQHIEWSPDGSKLMFDGCDYTYSIQIINADGSGLTQLLDRTNNNGHPTWSPDGRRIAFWSDRGGSSTYSDIYVMNADGTDITQLTDSPTFDFNPVWSR